MKAVTRERKARQKETTKVKNKDAAIFPLITGERSNCEISPTCKAVLNREPREAKIFPRIPMAAGTMMINPGSNSSVSEKVPKYIPPKRDPREARIKDKIPCLKTVARAEMNSNFSASDITSAFLSFIENLTRLISAAP